jgi:hypothetical protein
MRSNGTFSNPTSEIKNFEKRRNLSREIFCTSGAFDIIIPTNI